MEMHEFISCATAQARGVGEFTAYFISYNVKNIVDIIDSIKSIFTGLFIVMDQFVYASVMHPAAHNITNMPDSARKLLSEVG